MRPGFELIIKNAEDEVSYVEDDLRDLASTTETRKLWRYWSGILEHYVKAVSALRRATDKGSSKAWSDELLAQQRKNPFLLYARQARDSLGHVFEEKRDKQPRSVSIEGFLSISSDSNVELKENYVVAQDGTFQRLPEGHLRVKDGRYAGGSIPRTAVQENAHYLVLTPVTTRSGNWAVPNQDTPPEKQALEIGEYVLHWLKAKLAEALTLAEDERRAKPSQN